MGTDFNTGIKGIGPKKALALVKRHGSIEDMPPEIREQAGPEAGPVRDIFLRPDVTDDYSTDAGLCDAGGVVRYLCAERIFSEERVRAALGRAFPGAS
jgi:flap endonuclease-1